ncbi:hypothetical protein ACKA06_21455, partial [Rossellomorea oryzaecorticis]
TEVKLFSADGSWGISPCESRTSPGKCEKTAQVLGCFFVVLLVFICFLVKMGVEEVRLELKTL